MYIFNGNGVICLSTTTSPRKNTKMIVIHVNLSLVFCNRNGCAVSKQIGKEICTFHGSQAYAYFQSSHYEILMNNCSLFENFCTFSSYIFVATACRDPYTVVFHKLQQMVANHRFNITFWNPLIQEFHIFGLELAVFFIFVVTVVSGGPCKTSSFHCLIPICHERNALCDNLDSTIVMTRNLFI